MPLADRLPHTVTIRRRAKTGEDAQGAEVLTLTDLATVRAWVQPRRFRGRSGSLDETRQLNEAGATLTSHVLYLLPTDIGSGDQVFRAETAETFEVVGAPKDAGGRGRHLEAELERVVIA